MAHSGTLAVGVDQVATGRDVDVELPSDAAAAPWRRFVGTWFSVLSVSLPAPMQIIVS